MASGCQEHLSSVMNFSRMCVKAFGNITWNINSSLLIQQPWPETLSFHVLSSELLKWTLLWVVHSGGRTSRSPWLHVISILFLGHLWNAVREFLLNWHNLPCRLMDELITMSLNRHACLWRYAAQHISTDVVIPAFTASVSSRSCKPNTWSHNQQWAKYCLQHKDT